MNNPLFRLCDIYNKEKINLGYYDLEKLLGQIIINRMAGVAYGNYSFVQDKVPNEFKEALQAVYLYNVQKSRTYREHVRYLSSLLEEGAFKYALLKGAFLSTVLYEEGSRTSNDIDILINSEDISLCQKILSDNGFVQGFYSKEKGIIPATRRQIIQSRMNYGETVPFSKMIGNELLEVDINFSVDFKPSSNNVIVRDLLQNLTEVSFGDGRIRTLREVDFIIHLCCHLYKEATTYNWVERKNDLLLYKFCDINLCLHQYGNNGFFADLASRIKHFSVEKECYYTFENSAVIYPCIKDIEGYEQFMKGIIPNNLDFMKRIVFPMEKKLYSFDMSFEEWFLCEDRVSNLKGIPYEDSSV